MKITIEHGAPESARAEALVLSVFDTGKALPAAFKGIDALVAGGFSRLIESKDFIGKAQQFAWLYPAKSPIKRILLMGLGDPKKLNAESYRKALGFAAREIRKSKAASATIALPGGDFSTPPENLARAAVEGVMLGGYRFMAYKSKVDGEGDLKSIAIMTSKKSEVASIKRDADKGLIVAEGVCFARDLANTPALDLPPEGLAAKAREMGRKHGFSVKVLGVPELKKLGMNAILAVGGGSSRPPKLVVLEYNGAGSKSAKPIVIVGKGIAFDSGGISLKPPQDMERMKDDMSGAAATLAAMVAVAKLKLKKRIVGLMTCAENLPDGLAYRPGDVIRTASGITVEIISTDAEGRMVLCDALHHARSFNPLAVVDIATLTGAATIALGAEAAGLMSNDDDLSEAIYRSAEESGERAWPLPLWDEYDDLIRSDVADIKNAGSRAAGTIVGGMFLKRFVSGMKWAHLDIANLAWSEREWGYKTRGCSGAGVRILVEFLERYPTSKS